MTQPDVAYKQKRAEYLLGNRIPLPEGVMHAKCFYEGVIAYCETSGNKTLTTSGYKPHHQHYTDWMKGWEYARLTQTLEAA